MDHALTPLPMDDCCHVFQLFDAYFDGFEISSVCGYSFDIVQGAETDQVVLMGKRIHAVSERGVFLALRAKLVCEQSANFH